MEATTCGRFAAELLSVRTNELAEFWLTSVAKLHITHVTVLNDFEHSPPYQASAFDPEALNPQPRLGEQVNPSA